MDSIAARASGWTTSTSSSPARSRAQPCSRGDMPFAPGAAQNTGITLWEETIAEALQGAGCATALFGKWHLGGRNWIDHRTPIGPGFDHGMPIPNTSNEAQWTTSRAQSQSGGPPRHLGTECR
ncbi:MAG: sulfatase-like hydrolase/transferase [Gemmatimonadetes bacterium]|nr:sulfatase-like hydrolase/transferase [Gemmatimonadota bacterium]